MDNSKVIEEFRNNRGKVGGPYSNMELLLLHTIGARSGREIIKPVAYTKDGDNFVIAASKGGAPTNPDWYYNLLAHPDVTVEVGTDKFKVHAVEVKGEDRDRLYEQHATLYPGFRGYKAKTTRVIPVFILEHN